MNGIKWRMEFPNLRHSLPNLLVIKGTLHVCNQTYSHIPRAYISKRKRYFNVKPSSYYFQVKSNILADFQISISAPFKRKLENFSLRIKSKK